uniref:3-ketoacyl-[acyl-carrier-protein] reductase beta subunit n=1 Tax=Acanthochromis polyacanthus TaxID=80966 RepID=A0A3Q1H254_9TELE
MSPKSAPLLRSSFPVPLRPLPVRDSRRNNTDNKHGGAHEQLLFSYLVLVQSVKFIYTRKSFIRRSITVANKVVMSRLAVVCGGSRGIGKAVSCLLAERGCRLAVLSRNQDAAQATVASLHGADHLAFSCDVSKEQEVHKTFETIQKTCGNISYLVNAAGINRDALLLRTKPEDMVALLHTNLLGSMLTCRAALRSMMHTQGAAIVNIGSVVGLKGNAGQCVYSATKAGLEGFTRSVAKEVASRNIRVNLLAPGFIHTDMTAGLKEDDGARIIPLGRFGKPEEVAQAVLFLLESPYITGQVLVVDGGLQLAMSLVACSICRGNKLHREKTTSPIYLRRNPTPALLHPAHLENGGYRNLQTYSQKSQRREDYAVVLEEAQYSILRMLSKSL